MAALTLSVEAAVTGLVRPTSSSGLGFIGPVAPISRAGRTLLRCSSRGPGLSAGLPTRRAGTPCAPRATHEDRQQPTASHQQQGEVLRLPLDYYKLLQVPPVASRDSITTSFERLLNQPPALGYSQTTLLARGTTLKGILTTLTDVAARRSYDERLRSGDYYENVPDKFVPGILALLQESGESQTVVAAGEQWLSTHRHEPGAQDVALTTALAHSSVAEVYLQRKGNVLTAVRMLEVAGELLRAQQVGVELQQQIARRAEEMRPALACELVALPLERFQERERGLELVQALLTKGSAAARHGMPKQQFLDCLAKALTAAEMIQLYEAAGQAYAEAPSELYDVAVAYIAEGTSSLKPGLLVRAVAALQTAAAVTPRLGAGDVSEVGVKQAVERKAQEERSRRAVALSVCHLLLGETAGAHAALGLQAGTSEAGVLCDRSVLAFVKTHSPSRDDLLPGLCVLAQRWVADVAQNSFRGSAPGGFTLDAWFQDPGVQRYLSLREQGAIDVDGNESSSLRKVVTALKAPVIAGLGAILSPLGLLSKQEDSQPPIQQGEEEQALQAEASAAAGPAASYAGAPAAAVPAVPASVTEEASAHDMSQVDFRQARKERQLPPRHTARPGAAPAAYAAPSGPSAAAPAPVPPVRRAAAAAATLAEPVQQADVQEEEAAGKQPAGLAAGLSSEENEEDLLGQALDEITPLTGEERMWDSYTARNIRWERVAALAAGVAGAAFLAGRAIVGSQQQPLPTAAGAAPAAAAAGEQTAAVPAQLNKAQAAALIQRWQEVKAAALGPSHSADRLGSVLSGELLAQWQERARAVEERGWHYFHTLESSKVESVALDASAGTAAVHAVLCEAVTAHRGNDGEPQTFRTEYTVVYNLAHDSKGGWTINGAEVKQ